MWSRKATMRWRSKESVMSVQISPDDKLCAAGYFDGAVVIYDMISTSAKADFNISGGAGRVLPVTSLRFHPMHHTLLVSGSDGTVEKRDLKTLETVTRLNDDKNEVYCADYRRDGAIYATAGLDGTVRVYDDHTDKLINAFNTVPEHTANRPACRLYAVVFSPDDPNMLIASGWSSAVHVFDLRQHDAAVKKSLFGPYMVGDALDIRSGIILAASNRMEQQFQFIDSETGVTNDVAWPSEYRFTPLCAKFSRDLTGEFAAVGGGGSNGLAHAAFVYDRRAQKCVVDAQFDGTVNSCCFSSGKDGPTRVVFGDSTGQVYTFEKPRK